MAEEFPRCGKCDNRVTFELIHAAPDVFTVKEFRSVLYELPELLQAKDEQQEPPIKTRGVALLR